MTVLLVLAFIILFIALDYFFGGEAQPAKQPRLAVAPARALPAIVAGFQLPEHVRFHPGHTWAMAESPNLLRVGLDDFAARLTGKVDRVALPQRGQWIRQGQKAWTLYRDGVAVDMLSPVEGEVTEVNDALAADPELARKDPYGDGWMFQVNSPDAKTTLRNLLGGGMARAWMQEASARLQRMMPNAAGALAQDGGMAIDDLSKAVPDQDWQKLTSEFFLPR